MFPQNDGNTAVAAGRKPAGEGHENADLIDPDLGRLTEEWPTLPPAIKAAVMALVDAAGRRTD
jgi:hypothetical protein